MESADINWLAVVAAAFVPMVLGALWYSPVLFASRWMRAVGRAPEDLTGAQLGYALSGLAVNTYFGGRPRALWAIDAGYQLVALALMGAILGAWD